MRHKKNALPTVPLGHGRSLHAMPTSRDEGVVFPLSFRVASQKYFFRDTNVFCQFSIGTPVSYETDEILFLG